MGDSIAPPKSASDLKLWQASNSSSKLQFTVTEEFTDAVSAETAYQEYLKNPVSFGLDDLAQEYGLQD